MVGIIEVRATPPTREPAMDNGGKTIKPTGPLVFALNGEKVEIAPEELDISWTLNDYVRNLARLRGTKLVCGEGGCGACSVVLSRQDGDNSREACLAVNSCLRPLASMHGWSVTTVEGLGSACKGPGQAHPIQARLSRFNASQCGYCTPGMAMSLFGQLHAAQGGQATTPAKLAGALDGNICRCTGYRPILDAAASFTPTAGSSAGKDIEDLGGCIPLSKDGSAPSGAYDVCAHDAACAPPAFLAALRPAPGACLVLQGREGGLWCQPQTLEQVWRVLEAHPDARVVNGSTGWGVYKDQALGPSAVVLSLADVREMQGVEARDGQLVIGAGATLSELIKAVEGLPTAEAPGSVSSVLLTHLRRIAGTLVRNTATVGGNLKLAASEYFDSDLSTLLAGLGAVVEVSKPSPKGPVVEEVSLAQYLEPAGTWEPEETCTTSLLLRARFALSAAKGPEEVDVFRSFRVSTRRNNSHALANAAFRAVVSRRSKRVVQATLVVGAMGAPAARVRTAEAALLEGQLDQAALEAALLAMRKEVAPAHKTRYRYRLELLSSFLFKFVVALRAEAQLPVDPRLAPAAAPQAERPLIKSEQLHSKRWAEEEGGSVAHAALSKDYRGTQASGEAVYVADLPELEGTLFAAYAKSTRSVGKIAFIKTDKAQSMPGVVRVLTAADIPGQNDSGFYMGPPDVVPDHVLVPVGGRVQFHSQPVALVLATSQQAAQRAAKAVEMEFEGFEPPVVSIGDARDAQSSMGVKDAVRRGEAEAVIRAAKAAGENGGLRVVSGALRSASQKHFYLEPQTAYAVPDEDRFLVYSSTQAPEVVQQIVARVLAIPQNAVQVRMRRAGGAFGAKATRNLPHAAAAAVAAKVMRRPVRLTLDRETDMQLTGGRHAMEAEYEAAFHADSGRLEALKLNVWLNGGFCLDLSFTPCHDLTVNLEQAYYVPHAAFDVEVLRTNLPTSTAMRAPGVAQASFIMESVMDHIAAVTGLGGEAVREANFFGGSEQRMGSAGCLHLPPAPVAHWTLPRIWERLRASAGLASRREQAAAFNAQSRWRKRGVAMTPVKFLVPLQPMAATLNAYPDGSVLVHHGGCELGQGIHAKTALVALDVLGAVAPHAPLTLDMIRFADTDTDSIPNGGYTAGSTTSERACAAVHAAALEMARRLEPVKQRLLAAAPDGQAPAWAALVAAALAMGTQVDLCCHAEYRPEQGAEFYHNYGAAVAEVEVDALTGEVDLRAAHVLYDCGKSVNPAADMGQVEGAFVQGLGFFLTEEALIGSDGTLVSPGTWEYKPPLWTDLPSEWRVELLENGGFDKGFLSSKASGEPPLVLATSVMMAVREAVGKAREEAGLSCAGFRLDAPATAERVHRACGTHMGLLTLAEGGRGVWLDQAPREVIDVAVAGAGLGGLAMGIALKKVGLDARLFERAHALRDVSQGLVGITPNGLRALELIDPRLKEFLFEKGKYNTEAFTKTVDVAGSSERTVTFEANNLSIPWADIQHSLARLVPREMICCSHDFAGFEEDEDGVTVYFKGRVETVRAKLLIGVDGLFSNVRKAVMPLHEQGGDEVCESGHTNWNAIMHPGDAGLPYPHPVVSLTYQKADPPRFFFLIECGHGRVLWQVRVDDPAKDYTVASKKGHGRLGVGGVKARILELVEDVPDVRPYIEATPEEGIYERCLLFRKMLQRYSSPGRRVALVGDAAHGMHSVRGQGANMTFEDAHLLELALGKFGVGPSAIRAYEHSRIPRANMVQYESNTYYKRQFEKNTSHEWKLKFLNFQSYAKGFEPSLLPPGYGDYVPSVL